MNRLSRSSRLTMSTCGKWAEEIIQHIGLHPFNFQSVTSGHGVKLFRASGLADLREPPVKFRDPFLRHLQFLVTRDHGTTSAIPRFEPSRLRCHAPINSSQKAGS